MWPYIQTEVTYTQLSNFQIKVWPSVMQINFFHTNLLQTCSQPRNLHSRTLWALLLSLSKQQNVIVCVQCLQPNTNSVSACATHYKLATCSRCTLELCCVVYRLGIPGCYFVGTINETKTT